MSSSAPCTTAMPRTVRIRQYRDGMWEEQQDVLSREIPITILTDQAPPKTLWAWPHALEDLALGHVLLDMDGMGRTASVEAVGENRFKVTLDGPAPADGGTPGTIAAASLLEAMGTFMQTEGLWDNTGCFHRAGVLDAATLQVLHRAEDIGRHNCLDRLAGWAHREGVNLADMVMLVSARVTSSLCAKALRAGFRYIVSRSAVTTASVDMALEHNATLVGFARDRENRFTVFADEAGRVRA